jgi:phosphoribosylanthranilate isomerase
MAVWGAPDREAILRTRDVTGIRGVQLHGGSDPVLAEALRHEGMLVWRVLRLAGEGDLSHLDHMMDGADAVLIEPRVPGVDGGAGVALDLHLATRARDLFDAEIGRSTKHEAPFPRFVLAGGLRPDTVRAAIRTVRPDIVDVSSGVERAPGLKDPFLIRRFLDEALADLPPP